MSKVDELIARTRELDAAATPGPWDAMATGRETYVRERAATDGAIIAYADAVGEPTVSEYALIAEYRTLAPKLADMLERAMEGLRLAYHCPHCGDPNALEATEAIEAMAEGGES